MKKLLLLLICYSSLYCMEETTRAKEIFEYWQDLAAEIKSHILSFLAADAKHTKAMDLLSINRECTDLVLTKAVFNLLVDAQASHLVKTNSEKAKQIMLRALAENNQQVVESFAHAFVKLAPKEANKLLATYFTQEKINEAEPLLNVLLRAGFDPNQNIVTELFALAVGVPILHCIVLMNHVTIAQLLLEHGANPNMQDRIAGERKTALQYAILVQKNFDTLLKDNAIFPSSVKTTMISLLLKYNADPLLKKYRQHALELARDAQLDDVVNLLEDALEKKKNATQLQSAFSNS